MSLIEASIAMIGRVLADVFTSPFSLLFYLALLTIIAWQYHRTSKNSGDLQNASWASSLRAALLSTFFGLLGGLLGSALLLGAGVDLSRIGIIPLWIAALLLMMINPRFLCFAYAGGLLGIISLTLGYPQLSIPDLMALIAILHMVESLLIFLDARFYPIPVYIKRGSRLCGGFNLQKFWPVLLVVMMQGLGVFSADSPDGQAVLGSTIMSASIVSVLAVLGYGEVSTAFTPRQKSLRSAVRLFAFSAVLLILSLLATKGGIFPYLAVLFSPLGHEFIIWLGLREERNKAPIFISPSLGVMVLSTRPSSPAAQSGLQSGDVVLKAGGRSINSSYQLQELLQSNPLAIRLEGLHLGTPSTWQVKPSNAPGRGIIAVPDPNYPRYILVPSQSLFDFIGRVYACIRGWLKRV